MNASIVARTLRVRGGQVILLMVGAALLLGCSRTEPARPSSPPQAVVETPPPPPPPPPPTPPEPIQKKADVGSGEKGRGYGMAWWPRPWRRCSPQRR